jgi:thioredoxin-related protein
VTVALNSGDDNEVTEYMQEQGLAWSVINDDNGSLANRYGVKGVPALFIFNKQGQIVFTSVGYSTEFGLRLRLWLAGLID